MRPEIVVKAEAVANSIDAKYDALYLSIKAMGRNGDVVSLRSSISNLEEMKKTMEHCMHSLIFRGIVVHPNSHKIGSAMKHGFPTTIEGIEKAMKAAALPSPSMFIRYLPTGPSWADEVRKAEKGLYMIHRLLKHARKALKRSGG